MRTGADEERSPKYSHIERERRFLVDRDRLPSLAGTVVRIEDRYIIGTRFRLRRMTDEATGSVALKLAKKYEAADPTARPMVNAYLTAAEFEVFAALPAETIVKRRTDIYAGLLCFSVDEFAGELSGLVLAEIDRDDAAALGAIPQPDWAMREVSHDARFQGGALAGLTSHGLAALLADRAEGRQEK